MSRNLKWEYLENGESLRNMLKYDFYRGWYLPSNETIVIVVLRDLDLHLFQGKKAFSYYAFAIKKTAQAANVPGRFASTRTAHTVESLLFCNKFRRPEGCEPDDQTQ